MLRCLRARLVRATGSAGTRDHARHDGYVGTLARRFSSTQEEKRDSSASTRPLEGVRVLELGQLIAGPFAGTLLGYFGAEVIKIEPPSGDPIRVWRELDDDGTSPWWRSIGRNKKSVVMSLKSEEARALVRDLAAKSDVLIENFKPGKMEEWGLGPADLKSDLIYTRLSGYGQTGPLSPKPGYASSCEAFGGFRHVNGFPDRPPVRPNLSLGDTLAGIHAALGIALSLFAREKGHRGGEIVDVAIYEAVYNLMEGIVPEYDRKGVIREPSGSTLTGVVPTNTYPCADGKYVVIGGNGDSIYKRLMTTAKRPDLADDPRLASNPGRVKHQEEIDAAIGKWTASLPSSEVLGALDDAKVPSGPIYAVDDMFADAHYNERGMFESATIESSGRSLKVPAICPRLEHGRGQTSWAGPELGEHTREVLAGVLGLSDARIDELVAAGAVKTH